VPGNSPQLPIRHQKRHRSLATSAVYLAKKRFADDAGAYAGLVPRRSQSGERDYNGRISKAGDPMLRSALYEAANNLLCRVKRPSPLQTWGKALATTKGAKRARVAVARKLAILLHRLWQSDTDFRWA